MSDFKTNIKNLRKENGLIQKDIADHLNISRSGYLKYEKGTSEPTIDNLIKLSKLFNITIDELVGNELNQDELSNVKLRKETRENVSKSVNIVMNKYKEDIIKDLTEKITKR